MAAKVRLTVRAEQDLSEIYTYSFDEFGEDKADAYLLGLDEKFHLLASNPELGRHIDHVRAGYLRFEFVSHSVFYRTTDDGIQIVRVLHQRMNYRLHLG